MNKNYFGSSLSGVVHSTKFVDLHGRLVTVVEEETTREIYVSLTELKKSGFELFEAGSLPNPGGYLKHMTDLQISQFDMYLRMKAAKYLGRTVLSLGKDHIDDIIREQKEHYKLGQNLNRTVTYNNKGNYSITTKVEQPEKDFSNNVERKGNKMNYNNRENLNQNQQSHMQYQRSNNYKSPNTERNNTNSFRKSLHEDVGSSSNSFNSFTRNQERKPIQTKVDYSNTQQQPCSNSSYYMKPEPISDKPPSKSQNLLPLSPVPHSEKVQNNIPQKRVSNSDFASSSSVVSSTPVSSPITTDKPKEQGNITNRKCTVDVVSQGGMLECLSTVDDNTIVAYAVPLCYTNEFAMLCDIEEECQIDLTFAPAIDDMIAVFYDKENTYVRGIVINIVNNIYTCSLIDFGVLATTTNIRPLLKKFIEIPEFACYVTGSAEDLNEIKKEGNIISLEITSPGNLILEIEQTKKKYKVQAKLWHSLNIQVATPKLTENIKPKPLPVFKVTEAKNHLNSGNIVIIASEVNGSLNVRTRHCDILLKEVTSAIEKHQVESLKTPVVNQLVLCPYSNENDGSLYRAEVLSLDGQFANVRYVDYGDLDRVPISAFKTVNETLANFSNTYIAITLQEFTNKIFTTKQLKFLEECCNLRKKFTVVSNDDGQVIDLLLSDKTSLSKKLIDLEKPPAPPVVELPVVVKAPSIPSRPSSRSNTEERRYNIKELPDCVLKTGLNEVICIFTGELSDGLITFCPNTVEATDSLLQITNLIADHIEKDNQPYKPDMLELCVAKFEDEWCRATVVASEDDGVSVYFVDYGNASSVKYEDVRRISEKLVSFPAGGAVCVLKGINKDDSSEITEPILSKLLTHVKESETYEINVIKKLDDLYDITIPSVYKKLKEEGVL